MKTFPTPAKMTRSITAIVFNHSSELKVATPGDDYNDDDDDYNDDDDDDVDDDDNDHNRDDQDYHCNCPKSRLRIETIVTLGFSFSESLSLPYFGRF